MEERGPYYEKSKIKTSSETCPLPRRDDQLSKPNGGTPSGAWTRGHSSSLLEPEPPQTQCLPLLATLSVNEVSCTRLGQHSKAHGNQLWGTSHASFKGLF